VVPVINGLRNRFEWVEAVREDRPPGHLSFASSHGREPGDLVFVDGALHKLWPDHCVRDTPGAEFADGLDLSRVDRVFLQAADPRVDAYSGFFDESRLRSTGLREHLSARGVDEVHVAGLALERCVKWTALDARRLGFESAVILDACRGSGDSSQTVAELAAAGVRVVLSADVERLDLHGPPVPRHGQEKFLI
jgi:nicotinamidase/pyrazinamidase